MTERDGLPMQKPKQIRNRMFWIIFVFLSGYAFRVMAAQDQNQIVIVEKEAAKLIYEALNASIKKSIKGKYISETKKVSSLKCYHLINSSNNEKEYFRCVFRGFKKS